MTARHLPNLKQLRAFEAAARHLSFKAAAEELHVTHAAISHQIKALEEDLGRPLFRRLPRKVELLPDAEALALQLTHHLDEIAEATSKLRQSLKKGRLCISSVPAFGYRFVLPQLPDFHQRFPDIDLDIEFQSGLVEFDGHYDAALRYGAGEWAGLDCRLISRDEIAPISAPSLVAGLDLPLDPTTIAALPYAVSPGADQDWIAWARKHGLGNPPRPHPLVLDNRAVVLDFILSGAGIALTDLRFCSKELEDGRLVRLQPGTIAGVNGTYLVWPKAPIADPKITAFGDWLVGKTGEMNISAGCPWDGT